MGVIELGYFVLMATGTVFGRYNDRDVLVVVFKGICVVFIGRVTLKTANVCTIVLTRSPLLINGAALFFIARDTGQTLWRWFLGRKAHQKAATTPCDDDGDDGF
jgi:hypothetical protein